MQKTLVWELLVVLTPGEAEEAGRWLASPVHNQRADLVVLWEVLVDCAHRLQVSPTRRDVWRRLFPAQPFNDQELRLRCSYLLAQLEDWLSWRRRRHGPGNPDLLAEYRERGLERHFRKRLNQQRQLLAVATLRSPEVHLQQYQVAYEAYRWDSAGQRLRPQNFQEQDDALTGALLGLKLRQACLALAHQRVFTAEYRLAMLPEIMDWAQRTPYCQWPAVALYLHAYQSLVLPDDDPCFDRFRESWRQHHPFLPTDEARDLLLLALNFCIRRINMGNTAYLRQALDFYRQGLHENILLENQRLTPYTFNNIVGIAMRLGELDWAELFVQQYQHTLEPSQRHTHYALNRARLAYARRRYPEALQHLQGADDRDFFHHMTARILQLKVYYETNELDHLATHLKNTHSFLRRRRTTSYHEQNYRHILLLTEALLRHNPFDRAATTRLRERILATEPLTEREWLLAQLS